MTECNQEYFEFVAHFSRRVVTEFSADRTTTDGGSLLSRQVDRRIRLLRRLADCFVDRRDPARVEHAVAEMVAQRIYGLALAMRISTITSNCDTIRRSGSVCLSALDLAQHTNPVRPGNEIEAYIEGLFRLLLHVFNGHAGQAPDRELRSASATKVSISDSACIPAIFTSGNATVKEIIPLWS